MAARILVDDANTHRRHRRLVLSTILSLVVIPAFYVIAEKTRSKRKKGKTAA